MPYCAYYHCLLGNFWRFTYRDNIYSGTSSTCDMFQSIYTFRSCVMPMFSSMFTCKVRQISILVKIYSFYVFSWFGMIHSEQYIASLICTCILFTIFCARNFHINHSKCSSEYFMSGVGFSFLSPLSELAISYNSYKLVHLKWVKGYM